MNRGAGNDLREKTETRKGASTGRRYFFLGRFPLAGEASLRLQKREKKVTGEKGVEDMDCCEEL